MFSPSANSIPTPGCHHRSHAGHGRLGFSMVELIVVLAVVMLLTSLLMPGLQSARHSAYTVVCGANQRQLGIGFLLYGEDSNGHMPESLLQNQNEFAEMMAVTTGDMGSGSMPGYDGLGKLWEYRYIDSPKCLHCPAHRHTHTFDSNKIAYESLTGSVMHRFYANYHYTGHATHASCLSGTTHRDRRNMNRHDRFVLLTDGLRTREDFNHGTGMNVLFADGHYEYQADTANEISNALPYAGGLPSVFSVHHNLVSEIWLRIDIDGAN